MPDRISSSQSSRAARRRKSTSRQIDGEQERQRRNQRHWDRTLDPQNLRASGARGNGGGGGFRLREELRHWDTSEQRWAVRRLEPLDGRRVLELGGGLGVGAAALAMRGAEVVILDISLQRARAARRMLLREGLAQKVHIVVGEAENLPFRSGAFDRATTKAVLIHTNLPRAAREIHRVLRPGGRAVVLEPLDAHPAISIYRAFLAPSAWKSITRYWNRKRVDAFLQPFGGLKRAGSVRFFYLTGVLTAFFAYGPGRNRGVRRFFEALLDPLDSLLLRWFPALRWRCWFCGIEAVHRPQLTHDPRYSTNAVLGACAAKRRSRQ